MEVLTPLRKNTNPLFASPPVLDWIAAITQLLLEVAARGNLSGAEGKMPFIPAVIPVGIALAKSPLDVPNLQPNQQKGKSYGRRVSDSVTPDLASGFTRPGNRTRFLTLSSHSRLRFLFKHLNVISNGSKHFRRHAIRKKDAIQMVIFMLDCPCK